MKKCAARKILAVLLVLLLLLPLFPVSAVEMVADGTIELTNAPPNITARSAIVKCFETGDVLFARDPDTRRPPASMTKVMTAYIVYEEIAAGRLTLDTMIPISHHAANFALHTWPGHIRLPAGGHLSVDTLLTLIILPSHNGACIAVAEHISGSEAAFVQRMNQTAQRLGMDALYDNAHGLWGNPQTARATAILTQAIVRDHPDILRISNMRHFTFNGAPANNTGHQILTHPHIDGVKQGTTAAAGWCYAGTAFRGNNRVVSVTMSSSSNDTRLSDSVALLNFGLAELERRDWLMSEIDVELRTNVNAVRRNTDVDIAAWFNNAHTGGFTAVGARWTVNGQTVSTHGGFAPAWQQRLNLSYFLPANSDLQALDIGFHLYLPGGVTRSASLTLPVSDQPPALFRDINGHWAETQVVQAVERGLFSGVSGDRFAPNGDMTRAMFVTVLGRMARQMGIPVNSHGVAPFEDVSAGTWYAGYVAWAWEQGFVQGVGGNRFGTNNSITRQEVATLFYRFMQHYNLYLPDVPSGTAATFPDLDQIADWAYEAMWTAVRGGLITGFADGRLAPTYTATRAQLATMFLRFMNSVEDAPSIPEPPAEEHPEDEWKEENIDKAYEATDDIA